MVRNNGKTLALVALCVAVTGLSVGFAALGTNLTINGSAEVKSSTWKIKFSNLVGPTKVGNATEVIAPTIKTNNGEEATLIGDYSVTLMTPNDSISYTFDIVNSGDYDAKIGSITIPTPTCTGTGTNATTDATNVCDNLTYTLTYTEGGTTVKANDELAKGATKNVTLKLTYGDVTADKLPQGDVTITNLQIPITYVQN